MCALLGSEGSNIPFLNLTRGDVVWSPPAIVTLIVGVQIVAVRSFLSTVLHSRDYVELLTDRRVCDWLGRSKSLLKPDVVNREIRGTSMCRNHESCQCDQYD